MPQPPSRPRSTQPSNSGQNPQGRPRGTSRTNPRATPRTNPRTRTQQADRSASRQAPRRDRSPWQRFLPPFLNLEATSLEQGMGKFLVGLGAGSIVAVVALVPTVNRLHCDRQAQYHSVCWVRGFSLVGLPVRNLKLDPLQGAQFQPAERTAGYGTRVLLSSTKGQLVPFSVYGTTWETCRQASDRINAFLGDPTQESFTFWDLVPSPLLLTVLLGGGGLGTVGICLLWIAQAKTPIRPPG